MPFHRTPLDQEHNPNTRLVDPKSADESAYRLQVPMYNNTLGAQHRVAAGEILKLIDIAGCIPVKRHLGANLDPVTASIDRLDFISPVHPWEILSLDARMTRVWNTSMESRVVVTAWNFRSDITRLVAKAYVVAVATSERGKAKADGRYVPELYCITPEDQLLQHSAEVRKEYRQQEMGITSWRPIEGNEANTITQEVMKECDGNGLERNVFGGVILSHMFDAALEATIQHVGHRNVTCVRQDRMDFKAPTQIDDILRVKAVVTKSWEASLEVQVDCEAVSPKGGEARLVATTYLVFVGIRQGLADSSIIPEWVPGTEVQQHRAEDANERRRLREEEISAFGNVL
jgi:acyl-CoA hydrolase